jgi:hypothetical protein
MPAALPSAVAADQYDGIDVDTTIIDHAGGDGVTIVYRRTFQGASVAGGQSFSIPLATWLGYAGGPRLRSLHAVVAYLALPTAAVT